MPNITKVTVSGVKALWLEYRSVQIEWNNLIQRDHSGASAEDVAHRLREARVSYETSFERLNEGDKAIAVQYEKRNPLPVTAKATAA